MTLEKTRLDADPEKSAYNQPIPVAFNELQNETVLLGDLLERLRDRLNPILGQVPSVAGTREVRDSHGGSPVVSSICELTNVILGHQAKVRDLLEAIEV